MVRQKIPNDTNEFEFGDIIKWLRKSNGKLYFCKIAKREIPKEFTYEDDDVMVFPDIHPVRPVHLLIIPKQHFSELITVTDPTLFQKLLSLFKKWSKNKDWRKKDIV